MTGCSQEPMTREEYVKMKYAHAERITNKMIEAVDRRFYMSPVACETVDEYFMRRNAQSKRLADALLNEVNRLLDIEGAPTGQSVEVTKGMNCCSREQPIRDECAPEPACDGRAPEPARDEVMVNLSRKLVSPARSPKGLTQ